MDAIYGRQSVDKKDSISIESQIDFCKYETLGKEFEIYQDKGYSGKNTDRPDFQRLIQDIKKGKIEKVIVYKLDRISRSILDFANMMELFQKHKVEFVSCTEKFDTSTPMGRAMLNICIVFAQLERETIQMRVTDAYISRSEKGFYMGGRVPYGFKKVPITISGINTSKYEVIPEEAEQIKLMYSLYAEPNTSYGDIIAYFKNHNILCRRKPWDRARIADHLKNPIYVKADLNVYEFYKSQGTLIYNPPEDFIGTNGCYFYKGEDTGRKYTDLKGQKLVLAPHNGIVDSDTWLKCRIKCLKNKQIQPGRKILNTWLAGLVKCGKCGYALIFKRYKGKRAEYFLCSHKMNSKACEGAGTIHADEFEKLIHKYIVDKLKDFDSVSCNTPNCNNSPQMSAINIEISNIEQEIEKMLDKISCANDITMTYINMKIKELDERKKQLEKELAKLSLDKVDNSQILKITECIKKWDELSIEDKRQVASTLIEVIHATSEEVHIKWKI